MSKDSLYSSEGEHGDSAKKDKSLKLRSKSMYHTEDAKKGTAWVNVSDANNKRKVFILPKWEASNTKL